MTVEVSIGGLALAVIYFLVGFVVMRLWVRFQEPYPEEIDMEGPVGLAFFVWPGFLVGLAVVWLSHRVIDGLRLIGGLITGRDSS